MDWPQRIGRHIKLRDLHILLAVAKAGSMGRAAADLAVSQPVVSKSISDLEKMLGVRLFDRSTQGVEPTPYGRALLDCSRAVFDGLHQGVKRLEFLGDPTRGDLSIGCTERAIDGFAAAVIDQFSKEFPRATLRVVTGDQLTLRDRELRDRAIELAISATEGLPPDSDVDTEILFDDPQVLMVGLESKWARRRKIALKDLMQEAWILPPPETIVGGYIAQAFRAAGVEPPRAHIMSFSLPLCHQLLATGRFITMLPLSRAQFSKHLLLKVLPIESPPLSRQVGILTLKNRTLSPLAERFIECVRKVASSVGRRS